MAHKSSGKQKFTEEGAFEGVTLFENEYTAVLRYDDGIDSRAAYLTRDFLEVVKNTLPIYKHAAEALAAEILNSFAYAVMSTDEEGFLAHRKLDEKLHAFSFHSSARKLNKDYTEYLLTQSEVDDIYDQANGQITEWLDQGLFESDRAKKAANHNLALLSAKASLNGPL